MRPFLHVATSPAIQNVSLSRTRGVLKPGIHPNPFKKLDIASQNVAAYDTRLHHCSTSRCKRPFLHVATSVAVQNISLIRIRGVPKPRIHSKSDKTLDFVQISKKSFFLLNPASLYPPNLFNLVHALPISGRSSLGDGETK